MKVLIAKIKSVLKMKLDRFQQFRTKTSSLKKMAEYQKLA